MLDGLMRKEQQCSAFVVELEYVSLIALSAFYRSPLHLRFSYSMPNRAIHENKTFQRNFSTHLSGVRGTKDVPRKEGDLAS